ncbi:ubiquitin carboxyl-terminal hydrolase 22/27/51, partial [Clonorchis sinensis]
MLKHFVQLVVRPITYRCLRDNCRISHVINLGNCSPADPIQLRDCGLDAFLLSAKETGDDNSTCRMLRRPEATPRGPLLLVVDKSAMVERKLQLGVARNTPSYTSKFRVGFLVLVAGFNSSCVSVRVEDSPAVVARSQNFWAVSTNKACEELNSRHNTTKGSSCKQMVNLTDRTFSVRISLCPDNSTDNCTPPRVTTLHSFQFYAFCSIHAGMFGDFNRLGQNTPTGGHHLNEQVVSCRYASLTGEMTCKHVDAFFMQKTNILAHNAIVNYLTFPRSEKGFAHKASIECADCAKAGTLLESEQALRPRCLLACTHCIHFSCWHPRHLEVHRKERPEHVIYICIERGELYCALCSDFVYHPVAEQSRKTAHRMYLAHFGLSSETWRPSFDELTLLPHISSVVPLSTKVGGRPTRGLVNMGNTCFLNVVIQALTHTPVLRDYLLADLHRCNNPARSRSCLACEMIRVTQEIYSPVVTPFVPSNLLYAIWLHASHLAGYEQRDAHEFLITLLTLIHGHLIGEHVPLG